MVANVGHCANIRIRIDAEFLSCIPTDSRRHAVEFASPLQNGSTVTISVTASGTGPFDYRWWSNPGGELPDTGSSITVSPTQTTYYYVTVINACGFVESDAAKVTVGTCDPPTTGGIEAISQPDGSWLLAAHPSSRSNPTYTWRRVSDNVVIGTGKTVNVPAATATTQYSFTVADECAPNGVTSYKTIEIPLQMQTTGLQATTTGPTQITVTWPAVTGVSSYIVERRSGPAWESLGTSATASLVDNTVTSGRTYAYRVKITGSNYTNSDVATTMTFTAPQSGDLVTDARANEMLLAVNKVREAVGWPAVTWNNILAATDPVPYPGNVVLARHVTSCRSRMNEALQALGAPTPGYTDPDPQLGVVKALHVLQARAY